jgi:hypothetical protein
LNYKYYCFNGANRQFNEFRLLGMGLSIEKQPSSRLTFWDFSHDNEGSPWCVQKLLEEQQAYEESGQSVVAF